MQTSFFTALRNFTKGNNSQENWLLALTFSYVGFLIDMNVSAETDEYPSLRFQDIRNKPTCHGRTNVKTAKFAGGGGGVIINR